MKKEKAEIEEAKMPYRFYEKYRFKIYKKVGHKKLVLCWVQTFPRNYCEWKKQIVEKYQNVTDIDYLINFKADLNNRLRNTNQSKEIIPQLISLITLATTIIFATLTLLATIFQDNNSKLLLSKYSKIYLLIVIIFFIISALYLVSIYKRNKRFNFLSDYIEILDEMIEEKKKPSSTEDKD